MPSGCSYILGAREDKGKLIGVNFDFGYGFSHLSVPIVPGNSRAKYDESRQHENGGFLEATHFERPFALHGQSELGNIIYHIFDEFTTARIYHSQSESALLKQLLILVVRILTLGTDKLTLKSKGTESWTQPRCFFLFFVFLFGLGCGYFIKYHYRQNDYTDNDEDADHSQPHIAEIFNKCRRIKLHILFPPFLF